MKKVLSGFLIFLIVITAAGYLFLRSYLPDYNDNITAPGLKDPVRVTRNPYAVPSIYAKNLSDLYFAWGYVNAQDRMFQMEITKRIGQGRLSEFAGEATFSKDIFLKAVGFYDIAKQEAQNLPAKYQQRLQRYVDGINFYLETEKKPLYMTLLGIEKEKWTIADPIVVGMMLNWTLAYNMSHELLYSKIADKIGEAKARELLNLVPADTPAIVSGKAGADDGNAAFVAMLKSFGPLMGGRSASNNWAIAPGKTAGSGPILSSDPHVHGSKIPSDFYLIHAETDDFAVSGGQVAGLPFIAFGYNRHMAWGLTNQGADIVDVFFETVDWDKKTCILNGKETPLNTKIVEINIKGQGPVEKTLYYAGRRPLLNEVFQELNRDVSIDWVGFDGIGIEGFFELNGAADYAQFVSAANKIKMTPQNLAYADVNGNIAYRTIGALPDRKRGTGNFPQEGAAVADNWDKIVNPNFNPSALNPESGFIATANNKVIADYPYDMNGTYAPRYRYERIAAMLRDKAVFNADDVKKMQNDTASMLAKKIIPIMESLVKVGDNQQARAAMDRVIGWNAEIAVDKSAPSIYNTWLVRFMVHTFSDEIGEELASAYVGQRYISLERFLNLLENDSIFFDDVSTPEKEDAAAIATRAFEETLRLLEDLTGTRRIDDWQWGKIHQVRFDHFLGKSKLLRPFVNRGPFPVKGDGETNHRAHFYEVTPPFTATLAAGLRLVVQFDPEPKGYMVLITGENEYFLSRHYADMTDLWMDGKYFCLEEAGAAYETEMIPK